MLSWITTAQIAAMNVHKPVLNLPRHSAAAGMALRAPIRLVRLEVLLRSRLMLRRQLIATFRESHQA